MWGLSSVRAWLGAVAVVALSACGGGGGAGDPLFGPPSSTVTVSDLRLTLSASSILNTGAATVTATATAVDAQNRTVSGVPVRFAVDGTAILTASGTSTDDSGVLTASVSTGGDPTNRLVTVTASSQDGSIVRTATFSVTGAKILATAVPAIVAPGSSSNQVRFTVQDGSDNPMANVPISITSTGLATVEGRTSSIGEYVLTYQAPTTSGALSITASAAGASVEQVVQVQSTGTGTIPPASSTVVASSVAANPSVVAVGSSGASTIRAIFSASGNAPIANIRVRFDLNGDPNSIGGTLGTGSSIVYSDANGVATTTYLAGSRSSGKDGVEIRACWDYADFPVGSCPNSRITTLTVASEALSVTIGAGGELAIGAERLTYIQQFVVQVVDAAGQPKADVVITPSIDLLSYFKGQWVISGSGWGRVNTVANSSFAWQGVTWTGECPNEDYNRNGNLDVGEDYNQTGLAADFRTIEPRKSSVSISTVGSNKTNAGGKAVVQIEYPQSFGSWIKYRILVTGAVLGTEGRDTHTDTLKVLADAVNDSQKSPAFQFSPFGSSTTCTDTN